LGRPGTFEFKELALWLEELSGRETHRPVHYDLEVDLQPACGRVEVWGTAKVLSLEHSAAHPKKSISGATGVTPAGSMAGDSGRTGATGVTPAGSIAGLDRTSAPAARVDSAEAHQDAPGGGTLGGPVRYGTFLLNPYLTLIEAGGPRNPVQDADTPGPGAAIPDPDPAPSAAGGNTSHPGTATSGAGANIPRPGTATSGAGGNISHPSTATSDMGAPAAPLRVAPLDPPGPKAGTAALSTLSFVYRGTLPSPWFSSRAVELAFYNLWYPLFSSRLAPFTFRLLLRVPPEMVPAVNGRLVPLPPGLLPAEHDDEAPRGYLWESTGPTTDIAVCVGPYMVHQETRQGVSVEVHALPDDYDLGEL